MPEKSYTIPSIADLYSSATQIKADLRHPLVLLIGDLGAGKTTLIKALIASGNRKNNKDDSGSSPSYSLINEYNIGDNKILHIDLYRLNNPEEAFLLGIEDYLYSGHLCLVEWPQLILNYIQGPYHILHISIIDNNARFVRLEEYR